jgi:DNA (cytosine-5)-methyltransferase 1
MPSWYVKTIRSGARAADGSLPADVWTEGVVHPTLNVFDVGDTRAVVVVVEDEMPVYPIDTRNALRDPDKKDAVNRQGLGVGAAGDPSPTLTSLFTPAVAIAEDEEMPAYPIQGTVIGRKDTAGPQGKGHGEADDPMYTLDTTGGHAVAVTEENETIVFHPHRTDGFRLQGDTVNTLTAFMGTGGLNTPMVAKSGVAAYDEYNDSISETHHTLRAGTKQSTGAMVGSSVRRLTPVECERLQGFPDGWTAVDEKTADSHRYKQMGNAVTVNVIAWIGSRVS